MGIGDGERAAIECQCCLPRRRNSSSASRQPARFFRSFAQGTSRRPDERSPLSVECRVIRRRWTASGARSRSTPWPTRSSSMSVPAGVPARSAGGGDRPGTPFCAPCVYRIARSLGPGGVPSHPFRRCPLEGRFPVMRLSVDGDLQVLARVVAGRKTAVLGQTAENLRWDYSRGYPGILKDDRT